MLILYTKQNKTMNLTVDFCNLRIKEQEEYIKMLRLKFSICTEQNSYKQDRQQSLMDTALVQLLYFKDQLNQINKA